MVFSEIKESLSNHNFENAIMLIDNIEEKHQLEAKIYKSVVYVRKGDFGKGLKIANESIKLAKKKSDYFRSTHSFAFEIFLIITKVTIERKT
ncbi:MAG: hypothetical protein HeimC2_11350 [Candidatus Heimdallarchaeota archaeon LC_2]|nr:MAG: hypothetical protein HeimC2_11350 [Candidatus Heimdallarchaeota archaeon LC_2]